MRSLLLIPLPFLAEAGRDESGLGCTASVVHGAASVDGSAYAGMNADCSDCDGRITYIPGKSYTDEEFAQNPMRKLFIYSGIAPRYVGYDRTPFYYPEPVAEGEEPTVFNIPQKAVFEIPEVQKTYGYWESILPLQNEAGLGLGESSCATRIQNWQQGTEKPAALEGVLGVEGTMDLTNLMQLALERCATAVCGVKTMGALAEQYGFYPMKGEWNRGIEVDGRPAVDDGGEAVTLADRTGDAWVFHVAGGMDGYTKSIWAAQRVPKGHAMFIANNWVIRELPDQPNDDFLFSDQLHNVAKASGFWKEGTPLHFSRVFAPDTVTFKAPGANPIPLYASLRMWRLFNLAAPSLKVELKTDPFEMPLSVKVEKPISHRDLFKWHGDLYQGTEFDLSKGVLAGPLGNPYPLEGGVASSTLGQIPRGISIGRTVYSVVNQCTPENLSEQAIAAGEKVKIPVAWYGIDTPATSVFVPFFAGSSQGDSSYSTGINRKFTRKSAWWAFDFVNNYMRLNYQMMAEKDVLPKQLELQNMLDEKVSQLNAGGLVDFAKKKERKSRREKREKREKKEERKEKKEEEKNSPARREEKMQKKEAKIEKDEQKLEKAEQRDEQKKEKLDNALNGVDNHVSTDAILDSQYNPDADLGDDFVNPPPATTPIVNLSILDDISSIVSSVPTTDGVETADAARVTAPVATPSVAPSVVVKKAATATAPAVIAEEVPLVGTKEYLNYVQSKLQKDVVSSWWNLSDELIVKYNDGFYNDPSILGAAMVTNFGYPKEFAQMVGFNNDVHPIYVHRTTEKDDSFAYIVPSSWTGHAWEFYGYQQAALDSIAAHGKKAMQFMTSLVQVPASKVLSGTTTRFNGQMKDTVAESFKDALLASSMCMLIIGISAGFYAGRTFSTRQTVNNVEEGTPYVKM